MDVAPENKSIQSTRRRLKYLFHEGFLGRISPFIQVGQGSAETAYYLDKAGINFLQEYEEVFVYSESGQVKHHFLNHALDLSEFRVNFEIALKNHPIEPTPTHKLKKSYIKQIKICNILFII